MNDPALPPSDVADLAATANQVGILSRVPQAAPTTIPMLATGGNVRDNGYLSVDSTAYYEMVRCQAYVSARYLWWAFTLSDAYRSTVPTSIEWKLEADFPYAGTGIVSLDSGSVGTGVTPLTGVVDLFTAAGYGSYTQLASFQLSIKRTGGTGDAAGVKLPNLWVLRNVAV